MIGYQIGLNKNKRFLKQSKKTIYQKKRKRVKPAAYEELDNATYKWLKSATDRNVPVGANVLKLEALEFAKKTRFRELPRFRWLDGPMEKTIQSVSKLYQVCSCLQSWNLKILKNFSSAENNSLHGTFIPIPLP